MGIPQQSKDQRALYAVAVQFFINGMVISSFVPRLPEIRDALNVDLAVIGQILAAASLGGLFGSWLASKVITRFGTKTAMIFGTIAVILILPLISLASSVCSLFLLLALISMLDPIVDVAMNIQGSNISARMDNPVMNRLHGLWSVGSVVGGLIASSMAALAIALQWHLLAISFLMILALFYVGKGLLDSDEQIKEENEDENIVLPKTHVPISLWVFAILGGTALIPELIGSDWAPFRMADDLEASPGLAGMGYVAFTTGMVIGRLSGDWILVKFGKDNHIKYSVVLALAGLSVACLIDLTPLIFIGLTVAGTGIAVLFPALYDAAAQDPHRPSAALGAMTAGSRSILLIVPVSIGFLADSSIFSVGMAMAVFAIPSLLIMVNLSKRNKVF